MRALNIIKLRHCIRAKSEAERFMQILINKERIAYLEGKTLMKDRTPYKISSWVIDQLHIKQKELLHHTMR